MRMISRRTCNLSAGHYVWVKASSRNRQSPGLELGVLGLNDPIEFCDGGLGFFWTRGGFAGGVEGAEGHAGEHADDGDDDEEFGEGEAGTGR